MESVWTIFFGAGGLVLSVAAIWHTIHQSRGKRYFERAKGLIELSERWDARGALAGTPASQNSQSAHTALMAALDREARANTVLYLRSAARLSKPGSFLAAAVFLIYGGLSLAGLIGGAFSVPQSATPAEANGYVVGSWVVAATGVALVTFGFRQVVRRQGTKKVRTAIGVVDPLTYEGVAIVIRTWVALWHSIRAPFVRPAKGDT